MSFDDFTKTYLRWKIPKLHTLPDAELISWAVVSWIISKFSTEMPDTCGYVAGGLKFFNCYLVQTKRSKSQRRSQIGFLWYFFPPWVPLISKHHRTGANIEHYVTFVNTLATFAMIFISIFRGWDMPKIPKINLWLPSLWGSGLTHCQVATLKKLGILKLEENSRTVT